MCHWDFLCIFGF
ncbi:hypothetical protein FYJ71_01340 [Peptostreptococcus anaerobius]|uniref:Uncharacterized protein n=1 Tax=Peptostreptococcus porci TaxID=2652282 RepID=A0A6N7XEJ1_9FIRM|nr:hypothetical protein [Peptostreptococcus porci]